ncbi:MAG TPA: YetF domain-containing protein [Nitrososphaeraceae archaeon]|nr:YetF domain-containing protein [Nitrososphaeraceae archaeon]
MVMFLEQFLNEAILSSPEIIFSVILRTLIVTLLVLTIIRWLGNKGLGQLNSFELLIIIGIGSIIGDPMVYTEEISIPQAISAVVIIVVIFKGIDYVTSRSKRVTRLLVAQPVQLVKDGKYVLSGLKKARISDDEYKSLMRLNGIKKLEEVQESYLEMNGQVSFIRVER